MKFKGFQILLPGPYLLSTVKLMVNKIKIFIINRPYICVMIIFCFAISYILGRILDHLIDPQQDFIKDIFLAYITILSFGIPLSFEIVSRISERFESDIIYDLYSKNEKVNILSVALIINVFLLILLEFCLKIHKGPCWEIFAWFFFCSFIFITIYSIKVVYLLNRMTRNTEALLDMLFEDVENALK